MISELGEHTAGVISVQFHPRELLLVTGSADRTAMVWDLERFEPVSVCGPESTSVRCVEFHPDGTTLFAGALDSLRVGPLHSCVCCYMYIYVCVSCSCATLSLSLSLSLCVCVCVCVCVQTYAWEPTVLHDKLSIHWGKVADMAVSGEQLVSHQTL